MEETLPITGTSSTPAAGAAEQTGGLGLGALARRPFLTAALLLILGVLAHAATPDAPRLWLSIAGAAAALAVAFNRRPTMSTVCLGLAIGLTAAAAAQLYHFRFPRHHVAAFTTDAPRLAEVELIIDTQPRTLGSTVAAGRPLPPRQVTSGQVTRVRTWDGWQPATGRMLLSIDDAHPNLAFGQRVVALGMLSRPPPAMNPGQLDWARYYRQDRVLASLDSPHAQNVRLVEHRAVIAPRFALNALRQGARAALSKGFGEDRALDHALLRALLLGDHDPQLRDVQDDFRRTGTSHHLAISGLHVAILGGFVFLLCRLLRLSPRKAALVMMAFVVLYGVVALPSPPVVRSVVLCLCLGAGVMIRRNVDGVQLLALTACAMLVLFPLDLYDAGFQLSFGTVLGLMTLATPLARRLHREDEDERVLRSLGVAPGWFKSIRRWTWRNLVAAFAAGLVAWIVSAPLIIQHFDQLNPWAIPASLILAIPVLIALVLGLLKVILTLVCPWLAPLWAAIAALPVAVMHNLADALAGLPASDLAIPALPLLAVIAFYGLLAVFLWPATHRPLRVLGRGGVATACAALCVLPLVVGPGSPRDAGDHLRLTLLSVGAGQCAVVELPSGKTILIDAGSSTLQDLPRRCLEPFLRRRGIASIDSIYVSHANLDHFSAVARAAIQYEARQVLVTPLFDTHAAANAPARQMLTDLQTAKVPLTRIVSGERIQLDDLTMIDVLWPPPSLTHARLAPNDSSQVLRLTCAGRSILFTGDVQQEALQSLLRSGADLTCDVLIAPHHGSAEPATAAFLDATRASTILASSDRTHSRKQREFNRLVAAAQSRSLMRTDQCGAITVRVGKDAVVRTEIFLKR